MRKNSLYERAFFIGTWIILIGAGIFFGRPLYTTSEQFSHTVKISQISIAAKALNKFTPAVGIMKTSHKETKPSMEDASSFQAAFRAKEIIFASMSFSSPPPSSISSPPLPPISSTSQVRFSPRALASYVSLQAPSALLKAEDIWPYIIDGDLRALWQTGVTSASPLALGTFGLGSRSIVVYRARGKIWDVEEEVTLYDPPFSLGYLTRSESYQGQTHITIEEVEDGILLTYKVEKYYFTYSDRLWGPFTRMRESSELEFALNALKNLINKGDLDRI